MKLLLIEINFFEFGKSIGEFLFKKKKFKRNEKFKNKNFLAPTEILFLFFKLKAKMLKAKILRLVKQFYNKNFTAGIRGKKGKIYF